MYTLIAYNQAKGTDIDTPLFWRTDLLNFYFSHDGSLQIIAWGEVQEKSFIFQNSQILEFCTKNIIKCKGKL